MTNHDRFYVELGRKVYLARRKLDITQDALADQVGLSRTSITNIERGRQKLLLHTLIDFAQALQVEPADLLPEINRKQSIRRKLDSLLQGASRNERSWAKSALKQAS